MSATSMEQTKIILVRHGECQGNIENRFRGRKDYPLNERGRKQALELAKELKGACPQVIYSSPLKRALETAQPLAELLSIKVTPDEGFNNISLGKWEGRLKSEISVEYPEEWKTWLNNPEKLMVFIETLEKALSRAAGRDIVFDKVFEPMKPGDVPRTYASIDALRETIGFQPRTPIEEGLQKFADWYCGYYGIK